MPPIKLDASAVRTPAVPAMHKRLKTTTPRMDEHPLIRGAKALSETGRLSYEVGYLKPAKKLLVDLAVTSGALDRALTFANQMFLALEERGHRAKRRAALEGGRR